MIPAVNTRKDESSRLLAYVRCVATRDLLLSSLPTEMEESQETETSGNARSRKTTRQILVALKQLSTGVPLHMRVPQRQTTTKATDPLVIDGNNKRCGAKKSSAKIARATLACGIGIDTSHNLRIHIVHAQLGKYAALEILKYQNIPFPRTSVTPLILSWQRSEMQVDIHTCRLRR